MPLDFTDYDPYWPTLASQAMAELMDALPGLFSAIEHVGSTSVPGLAAKPIIDLIAAARAMLRHTICTLSRPRLSPPGISCCSATTCVATRTTLPGTGP